LKIHLERKWTFGCLLSCAVLFCTELYYSRNQSDRTNKWLLKYHLIINQHDFYFRISGNYVFKTTETERVRILDTVFKVIVCVVCICFVLVVVVFVLVCVVLVVVVLVLVVVVFAVFVQA